MLAAALRLQPRNHHALEELERLEAQWAAGDAKPYAEALRQLARDAARDPRALTGWGRDALKAFLEHKDPDIGQRRREAYAAVIYDAPWWLLQLAARVDDPGHRRQGAPSLARHIEALVLWRVYRRSPVRVQRSAHEPGAERHALVSTITREFPPIDQALVAGLMRGRDLVGLGRDCGLPVQTTRRRLVALRAWVEAA